jgi:4-hydroxybenzoate polyprenyltransferase
MIVRLRVLIALSRPPVLFLLGLFAMVGRAQAGSTGADLTMLAVLVIVAGFLLFSVAVNDIADEAVDRVNLPTNTDRPLVTGGGDHRALALVATTAAAIAVAAAAMLGLWPLVVLIGGLVLSAAYSLPPTRLSSRGAVASLLLPAGYVAVPFLVARLAAGAPALTARDLLLLGGLYVGFIGRIVLKDFRDVVGDAQFGKRTFLVRYGRRATCTTSAVAWTLGVLTLLGVRDLTPALVVAQVALTATALVLLKLLADDRGARRDEWIISAIAIVGRGVVVTVIAHLGMAINTWPPLATNLMSLALAVITIGQAHTMLRHGPSSHRRVPAEWQQAVTPTSGPRIAASASPDATPAPLAHQAR